MVDALCADLQRACGLTRVSIVVERTSGPVTITLQNEFHGLRKSQDIARLELELRDGDRRLGEVLLEDALARTYPLDLRRAADEVLVRHAPALREAIHG